MELFPDVRTIFVFVLATLILGGGAAWQTGRAIALAWRPWWRVILPMLLLALGIRFIHYAVFRGMLLSLPHYVLDAAACLAVGLASFRVTRVGQMVSRYKWINERAGPLTWRPRTQNVTGASIER